MQQAPVKILAIIPARGGSKRLPGKNIRFLGDKPLIVWSIEAAAASALFCDVLVTTDAQAIAQISSSHGALVPGLRPSELSADESKTIDVLHHALQVYESKKGSVGAVALLQPTSPFRKNASLVGAVDLYLSQNTPERHPVVSLSPSRAPAEWCFKTENHRLRPVLAWDAIGQRSQELQTTYHLNGSIYIVPAELIRSKRPLIAPGSLGYVMESSAEAIDIDTPEDWSLAEHYLQMMRPPSQSR